MTDSINDLLHRARTTPPSSLNDAMRTIDLLADALERCSAESTERSERIDAKDGAYFKLHAELRAAEARLKEAMSLLEEVDHLEMPTGWFPRLISLRVKPSPISTDMQVDEAK